MADRELFSLLEDENPADPSPGLRVPGCPGFRRSFQPGFRLELHRKDLGLALSGARALGLSLPNTALVQELFNACVARGWAQWDHSALVKALESLACHELSGEKICD